MSRPPRFQAWRTPPGFYDGLDAEFRFALDAACTRANCLAPGGLYHDEGRDGLLEEWGSPGSAVWCNPPYARPRPWIERAVLWGATRTVVMLVPADTCVGWWMDLVAPRAGEVRLVIFRPGSAPWAARYTYIGRDGRPVGPLFGTAEPPTGG